MSPRRAPAPPPEIPGYSVVRHLGSGGFADVFLYEQQRPRRKVAIKVLLPDVLGPEARRQFDAEADTMAQLSTHPAIVTIYEAAMAPDGRPYLAMEYCPRPNYGARFRQTPLTVPDALRVGIQVAGAVETAHRAGILHRDIKPANILVTEYNNPALTDFGIAGTVDGEAAGQAAGMSIPWSPPESFDDAAVSTVGTDVWALGATVYSLLAARSPFEIPGGPNGGVDLIARIERTPLPPTGRPGVPDQLERVLATAMAKSPASRYPSALAFARALQQVQIAESLAVTTVDVLEDVRGAEGSDDAVAVRVEVDEDPGTRIRSVRSIDPGLGRSLDPAAESTTSRTQRRELPDNATGDRTAPTIAETAAVPVVPAPAAPLWAVVPEAPPVDTTMHRPGAAQSTATVPDVAPPRRRWAWVALVCVVLAAGGVAAASLLQGDGEGAKAGTTADMGAVDEPADPAAAMVPTPEDLAGTASGDGTVTFTWVNPAPQDGDTYRYVVLDELGEGDPQMTAQTSVSVPADADGTTCLQVQVDRNGRLSDVPAKACNQ